MLSFFVCSVKVLCCADSFISVDTGKQYLVLVPQFIISPSTSKKKMHQTVPLLLSYISVTEQQHCKEIHLEFRLLNSYVDTQAHMNGHFCVLISCAYYLYD